MVPRIAIIFVQVYMHVDVDTLEQSLAASSLPSSLHRVVLESVFHSLRCGLKEVKCLV